MSLDKHYTATQHRTTEKYPNSWNITTKWNPSVLSPQITSGLWQTCVL